MVSLVLPVELYRWITEAVDDAPTLVSLLFVSRAFSAEAERLLYHTVRFTPNDSQVASTRFFETLAACARIANLVHSLYIHQLRSQPQPDRASYRALMSAALLSAVNITDLSLHMPDFDINDLAACTFQLRKFRHDNSFLDSATFTGTNYTRFLAAQPLLEHLEMYAQFVYPGFRPAILPPAICQNLSTLIGDSLVIYTFLPGRRIRNLRWELDPNDYLLTIFPDIAEALHHVYSFSLNGIETQLLPLSQLVDHLKDLHYLELASDIPLDLEPIYRLTHLRGLSMSAEVARVRSSEEALGLVTALFAAIPDLRFIEVQPWADKGGKAERWRWERAPALPAAAPSAPAPRPNLLQLPLPEPVPDPQ